MTTKSDALGLVGQLMDKFALGYLPKKPEKTLWDKAYGVTQQEPLYDGFMTL
jgi:hypothetical protein